MKTALKLLEKNTISLICVIAIGYIAITSRTLFAVFTFGLSIGLLIGGIAMEMLMDRVIGDLKRIATKLSKEIDKEIKGMSVKHDKKGK